MGLHHLLSKVLALPRIRSTQHGAIEVRGMQIRDLAQVRQLYATLNDGDRLSSAKVLFYALFGARMALVAHRSGGIVGFCLYSFGARDLRENTVHTNFTGVAYSAQRMGVATTIKQCGIRHFSETGIAGISTWVSCSNTASLKLNAKFQFRTVETFFDPIHQEEKYYLVRDFRNTTTRAVRVERT